MTSDMSTAFSVYLLKASSFTISQNNVPNEALFPHRSTDQSSEDHTAVAVEKRKKKSLSRTQPNWEHPRAVITEHKPKGEYQP